EHDDLAVVADLEQLLRTAVHVADDRVGRDDPFPVQDDPQPEHAVRRRMLRTDVEDHVGGGSDAHADIERPPVAAGCRSRPGHGASLPHRTEGRWVAGPTTVGSGRYAHHGLAPRVALT